MSQKKAIIRLRESPTYRRNAFDEGLRRHGFRIYHDMNFDPSACDVLVLWNRTRLFDEDARRVEAAGGLVLVAENGYLGKNFAGHDWISLAIGHHAGAGKWPKGGNERWDSLNVELKPWQQGAQTLILGQRGIGEIGIASPDHWAEFTQQRIGGRIRPHPGKSTTCKTLEQDLDNIGKVVTWASGSALKSLIQGVPVYYDMPKWIGAKACLPLSEFNSPPLMDDEKRLGMFRRLAWAMWTVTEIESGAAFDALKCS